MNSTMDKIIILKLIAESEDILDKIGKLAFFLASEEAKQVEEMQIAVMKTQMHAMEAYLSCLTTRIRLIQNSNNK